MRPLKWYKESLAKAGMTRVDKVVAMVCLSAGAVCCLAGSGLFFSIILKIATGSLTNRIFSGSQAMLLSTVLILFLLFTAVLCVYTLCLIAKKEVIR